MNDRWNSVSINLMEVLSASRNLFLSDSFDVIAVFKTIRDAHRTRNLLKIWDYLQYFGNLRRGIIRHRQLSNGTNDDDLYICIATVGNTIQTVNSPMYDTYMSTPGNTAKLTTAHSNIQTAQRGPSLVGSEPTMH